MECANLITRERSDDSVQDTTVVEENQVLLSPARCCVNNRLLQALTGLTNRGDTPAAQGRAVIELV